MLNLGRLIASTCRVPIKFFVGFGFPHKLSHNTSTSCWRWWMPSLLAIHIPLTYCHILQMSCTDHLWWGMFRCVSFEVVVCGFSHIFLPQISLEFVVWRLFYLVEDLITINLFFFRYTEFPCIFLSLFDWFQLFGSFFPSFVTLLGGDLDKVVKFFFRNCRQGEHDLISLWFSYWMNSEGDIGFSLIILDFFSCNP